MTRDKLIGRLWDIFIIAVLSISFAVFLTLIYVAVHFIRKFW